MQTIDIVKAMWFIIYKEEIEITSRAIVVTKQNNVIPLNNSPDAKHMKNSVGINVLTI